MAITVRNKSRPQVRAVIAGLAVTAAMAVFTAPAFAASEPHMATSGPPMPEGQGLGHATDLDSPQSSEKTADGRPLYSNIVEAAKVASGGLYTDPSHADTEGFLDKETGETLVLQSGITHWSDLKAASPFRASTPKSQASYSEVFPSVTMLSPAEGGVAGTNYDGALIARVELDVPSNAVAGDTYTLVAPSPFGFYSSSSVGREIKDSNGKVFAFTTGGEPSSNVPANSWRSVRVVLTDEVEAHAEVVGFIDFSFNVATKATEQAYTFNLESPDGIKLGPGKQVRAPKSSAQSNDFVLGNATIYKNQPTVSPAVKVAPAQMKAGLWFKFESMSSGLTAPPCDQGILYFEGFLGSGFYSTATIGAVSELSDVSCSASEDGKAITFKFAKAIPAPALYPSGGVFRLAAGAFAADKSGGTYEMKITTNWDAPHRGQSTQGTVKSGTPIEEGSSHLYLTTAKSATFTSASGDPKPTGGDTITYTITTTPGATNGRPVNNLITADKLPPGLRFISATNGGQYNAGSKEIVWGPRTLTSTGKLIDTVVAQVVSVPASGSITNTVQNIAEEVCNDGDKQSVCEADVTTPIARPDFEFTKSSSVEDTNNNGWLGDLGDTIVYTFTVKNTGQVTLRSAKLTDDLLKIKDVECLPAGQVLSPGASTKCVGTHKHVITEDDVEVGEVVNHATLCVDPVLGLPCEPGETTTVLKKPAFDFVKSSKVTHAPGERGFDGAIEGDVVTYWFTATNTGSVDLDTITIDDELLGLSDTECLAPDQVLKPGDATDCVERYDYKITKDDQENGKVLNIAVGKVPGLPDVPSEVIDPTVDPSFSFDKSVVEIVNAKGQLVSGGKASEGDRIHFGFTAKNTGNVDLKKVLVTDPLLGTTKTQCLAEETLLKVGQSVACADNASYWYTVTSADVRAGKVHNVATGSVPGLPDLPGETTTPVIPDPVITELPRTGAGGTWLFVGVGSVLTLGGIYALVRMRRNTVRQSLPT